MCSASRSPRAASTPGWPIRSGSSGSHVVVELKFTGTYPGWFAQLVRTHGLIRCGAAKYVDGATLMGLEPGGRRSGGRANGPATLSPRAHLDRRERLVAAYH